MCRCQMMRTVIKIMACIIKGINRFVGEGKDVEVEEDRCIIVQPVQPFSHSAIKYVAIAMSVEC